MKKTPKPYLIRMFTPDRMALLRKRWRGYDAHNAIIADLNELPGPLVTYGALRKIAHILKIKRPDAILEVVQARRRAIETTIGIEAAIRSARRNAKAKAKLPRVKKPKPAPKPRKKKPSTQRYAPGLSMGRIPRAKLLKAANKALRPPRK